MAEYNKQPVKKPTVWDLKRLSLRGVPWKAEEPRLAPGLAFSISENMNPSLKLYMNDKESNADIVYLQPSVDDMFEILVMLERTANGVNNDKLIKKVRSLFKNGRKQDKPYVAANISVGRDSDGVIYLSVHALEKQPAVFNFLPSFYGELFDATGESLNKSTASDISTLAYVKKMTDFITTYMVIEARNVPATLAITPPPRPTYTQGNQAPVKQEWNNFDEDIGF